MTPLAVLMAALTAGVVVLFPVAVVVEWRNTRPERGTIPVGRPPRRRRLTGGPLRARARKLAAEAANLAEWGAYAARVASEHAWAFEPSRLPERRMMDRSPLWAGRPAL